MKNILHDAIEYLANQCDGAQQKDGAGFSMGDSYNGKYLAFKGRDWTEAEYLLAAHYATKYGGQLGHLGTPLKDAIVSVGEIDHKKVSKQVTANRAEDWKNKTKRNVKQPRQADAAYYKDGLLYTDTAYDKDFLEDSRAIPSRKYVEGRVTSFSPIHLKEVLELCERYDVALKFDPEKVIVPIVASKIAPKNKREIFINKGKLIILFPYDPSVVAAVKELKLAKYGADPAPHWNADVIHAGKFVEALKDFNFEIEDSVLAAAQQGLQFKEAYKAADTAFRVDLPNLKAGFKVLEHQWVPIEWAKNNGYILNADSQGLGKTFVTLTTMVICGKERTVVVAPSSLTGNWEAECGMFYEEGTFTTFHAEGRTVSEIPKDVNVVIIGWPNLSFWIDTINKWQPDCIVVDEAHYGKSGKGSKRGQAFIDLGKKNPNALKIALTGTPILNRPLELLAILLFFGIEKMFGGITKFKHRYCGPKLVPEAQQAFPVYTFTGATNLEELHEILTSTGVYVRRTKKLLMDQGLLKKKYVNKVEFFEYDKPRKPTYVKLNKEEQAEYDNVEKGFRAKLNEARVELARQMRLHPNHPLVVNAIGANKDGAGLGLLNDFRKSIGKLKVRAISQQVRSLVERGEKVVVFAHHREVVDAYAEQFGNLKIQGGMGTKKIEEAKAKFNKQGIEEYPVLVVSIEAGKTGHTLCLQRQFGVGPECAYVIFAEEPYVYGDAEQAEDRIYRIGQSRDVYIDNMLVMDTVDERIYDIRESKRAVFNALVDGIALEEEDDESVAKQILKGFL